MGREWERKYRGDPQVFAALQQRYGDFHTITMETTYYDTPDGQLSQRRWMLRRRLENGQSVCTLKTPLPDGSRGEWEGQAPSIREAIETLCRLGCPPELRSIAAIGLVPTCAARFTREAAVLTLERCTLELALDRGVFLGENREQPFLELEIEYKGGSEEAAAAFADALAEEFSLVPEEKSKVQRALALQEKQNAECSVQNDSSI